MIKAIYFDLFFTLIVPAYEKTNNEYNILYLPVSRERKIPVFLISDTSGGTNERYS